MMRRGGCGTHSLERDDELRYFLPRLVLVWWLAGGKGQHGKGMICMNLGMEMSMK